MTLYFVIKSTSLLKKIIDFKILIFMVYGMLVVEALLSHGPHCTTLERGELQSSY